MTSAKSPQTMKPETAAKKLGVLLSATPADFQNAPVSRATLNSLLETPPAWLEELRRTGPHPRPVVAAKLGVSVSGLARAGVDDSLTTAEITALLADPPQWLVVERATQAEVRAENRRIKERNAERRANAGN